MWRVDVIQPDGTIKREQRSKTFVGLSERAARAAFQPILDSVNAASGATPPVPRNTATLSNLVAEWREQIAGTLKPSTRKAAESHLRRHIEPLLGDCALPELTAKRLQAFVTSLSTRCMTNGEKRTRKTIENILLTLSSILSAARTWGYTTPKVSLSELSLPQDTSKEARCLTFENMREIISSADEPLATICFLLSVTGMRIGEVLALRVEDLDFRRKLVKIKQSTYAGQIGTPKSKASIADLPMPGHARTAAQAVHRIAPLSEERPWAFVCESPRPSLFSEQAAGEKVASAACRVGDTARGVSRFPPCGSQRTDR